MNKSIYFGKSGITSTSANTVANWAKEYVSQMPKMNFVDTTLSLLGSNNSELISKGITSIDTDFLYKRAKAYSLIAWLREAIKARDTLKKSVENLSLDDYCSLIGVEEPIMPDKGHVLTEEEYWDSRSIKERNRYYELETLCSVIGKFIHPDSPFSNARKELNEYINNPINVVENGRDTVIYKYVPSISPEEVEKTFFALQAKHREYQSQLNAMKYECENACMQSETEVQNKYVSEITTYQTTVKKLQAELNKYKHDKMLEISKLKIVIPESLVDIYNEISNLGKTSQK